MIRPVAYLLPLAVAACAPMSVERAMSECESQVGLADGIGGHVSVGVGTGGTRTGASIVITNDILNPKTPEEFYEQCVARKSGQAPTRPLGAKR